MKKTAQKPVIQTKPALFGLDRKDLKLVHGGKGAIGGFFGDDPSRK